MEAAPEATPFSCRNCGAAYKVVRLEPPPAARDHEITCTSCGAPLNAREGRFVLKYFLVERPTDRKRRGRIAGT